MLNFQIRLSVNMLDGNIFRVGTSSIIDAGIILIFVMLVSAILCMILSTFGYQEDRRRMFRGAAFGCVVVAALVALVLGVFSTYIVGTLI